MSEEFDAEEHLFQAMKSAKKAFVGYFEGEDLDDAFWQLSLTGWVLSDDFIKLKKISMEDLNE